MLVFLAGGMALWLSAAAFILSDEAAAACAARDVPYEADPAVVREAMLCEIAAVRERRDARRLRGNAELDVAAGLHAADMYQRRYFSHVSPGGGDLGDRVRRSGFALRECSWGVGEVLAWGVGSRSPRTARSGRGCAARRIAASWSRSATGRSGSACSSARRSTRTPAASRSLPCSAGATARELLSRSRRSRRRVACASARAPIRTRRAGPRAARCRAGSRAPRALG